MRKSKFMKALLVFGMSVVTATSMVGIAACNPDSGNGDDNGNGNGHQHSYDGWNTSKTEHWHECLECSEEADRGNHVDVKNNKTDAAGADNYCDVCGYELAHTFADTWSKDASGHWHAAICDHTSEIDELLPHVDADKNNVCDECEFVGETSQGYKDFVAAHGSANKVLDDTFFVSRKLPVFSDWGTPGLYASHDNETNKVDISGGKANLITPNANPATCLHEDFGDVSGTIIEGYFDMSDFQNGTSGYTPVQFQAMKDGSAKEVFGLRAETSWKYRVDEGSYQTPAESIAVADCYVYFSYNSGTNELTVKINDKVIAENVKLSAKLIGIKFSSGSSNNKTFSLDNIIVVSTPMDLTEYKTAIQSNVTAEKGKVTAAGFDVDSAISPADQALSTAMESATTTAEITSAYNTWFTHLLTVYGNAVKNRINTTYPSTSYDDEKNEDHDAYVAAVEKLATDLTNAKSVESITAAYKSADATIKDLGDDTYWTSETFVLTVNFGASGSATIPDKRSGDKVTKAELDAVVTGLSESEVITGYTVNDVAVDFGTDGYVVTQATTFVAVISQVTSDKGVYTYTVADSTTVSNSASGSLGTASNIITAATSFNASDFKFASNSELIKLKFKVTVGQSVSLKLTGFTGSKGNASGVKVEATGLTTSDSTTLDLPLNSKVTDQASGTINYTVSAAGEVTLVITRSVSKTARITEIVLTIADPA